MIKHTDHCWHCCVQKCDSCDCLISSRSGYESEYDRNYADPEGLDAYRPCKYYVKWEEAIEVLEKHCEGRE